MSRSYDVSIDFARVSKPGNNSIGVKGFERPSTSTVPAQNTGGSGSTTYEPATAGNYQQLGAVPYSYEIGQYEVTAKQYVSFLNAVDPDGSNDQLPWTGITLYDNRFSPIENPYQGQIIQLSHASKGQHYALANENWADKPMMWANMFQYLYFINALSNGEIVAEKTTRAKSPEGFNVKLSTKYVRFSDDILSGAYNLNDYNYPYAQRQNTSGFVLPSENEWVKAAYYAGSQTSNGTPYYYYPTGSNQAPAALTSSYWASANGADSSSVNVNSKGEVISKKLSKSTINTKGYANYDSRVFWAPDYTSIDASSNGKANVTNVGGAASPSPWLTYDQGGNLVEYTDTVTAAIQAPDSENKENVPVYFKVHGGIANATEYQLWITATGTSNPYGQNLGSMYQYGGARLGFLPSAKDNTKSRSANPSSIADPLTGQRVVTRVDSLETFDTFYTTSNANAINALQSDDDYLFMAASFRGLKNNNKNAVDVYQLLHTPTDTHYYTTNASQRDQLLNSGSYTGGDVGFRALAPGAGATDFVRYFNSTTGAYGFSAAAGDVQFFTSRGYVIDGVAWSI
jgi:formylglycine-generating enzyme required for sulfatase activity